MNLATRLASLVFRAAVLVGFNAVIVSPGYSQMPVGRGQIVIQPVPTWVWPYDPALMPYWGSWYSPCYPFASCSAYQQFQIQERRRERLEELRREQPTSPALGINTWRGQVPSTNDANVQPDYLGSGQIRGEHRKSGEFLPEFLEGKVHPSR